jgi:hypothetical protein
MVVTHDCAVGQIGLTNGAIVQTPYDKGYIKWLSEVYLFVNNMILQTKRGLIKSSQLMPHCACLSGA